MFFLSKDERLRFELIKLVIGLRNVSILPQLYKFVKGDDHALDDVGEFTEWLKEKNKWL